MNVPIACNPDSGGGAVCRLLPPCGVLPPRGGLTLIEILMTIFVLAIGLLGVAALLPVGTFQMRQGQIAQRSAEIGSGALDTIEASGMHKPGRWLAHSGGTTYVPFDAVVDKNWDFGLGEPKKHPVTGEPLDPEYVRIACPVTSPSVVIPPAPYAPDPLDPPDLATLTVNTASPPTAPDNFQNSLIGFARCQKPTVWGTQWRITDGTFTANYLGKLPSYATLLEENDVRNSLTPDLDDIFVIKRYGPFAIDPLYVTTQGAAPDFAPNMARLTLSNGLGAPLNLSAAEAIFQATDDLLFTPGTDTEGLEDESKLPEPPWPPKVDATGRVSPRPSLGNYSWLATFVPVEAAGDYRDGCSYTVSVAVFYKRPLQLLSSVSERTLTLTHTSGSTFSISGTTFENQDPNEGPPITFNPDDGDESYIKSGQWGLVTYLNGTEQRAGWYRLGSVGKPANTTGYPVKARLIGPDLPMGTTGEITFFEGLVAVFERTIQVPELPIGAAP